MEFSDVDKIYIAGGFGSSMDLRDAAAIGLIPEFDAACFTFLGNAALAGARLTLVSDIYRQKQAALAARITYMDLSDEPSYMDEYTAALFLPHTDAELMKV